MTRRVAWTRVPVEGVVIVGSILLAFGIDAWWEGRLERGEERETIAALREEFTADLIEAQSVIAMHEGNARLLTRFLSLDAAELRSDPQDSVSLMITALAAPRTFDPIRGTLDALIGSGKLGVIRDRELREALTSFSNVVDDAKEAEWALNTFAAKVWEAEVRHGGPWVMEFVALLPGQTSFTPQPYVSAPTNQEAARVRADAELIGLSKVMHQQAGLYLNEVRRAATLIQSILDRLEAHSE